MEQKEKVPETKLCPVTQKACIGNRCAWNEEMLQIVGGMQRRKNLCALLATNALLSEINMKLTQKAQKPLQLPNLRM